MPSIGLRGSRVEGKILRHIYNVSEVASGGRWARGGSPFQDQGVPPNLPRVALRWLDVGCGLHPRIERQPEKSLAGKERLGKRQVAIIRKRVF